uniref:DUF4371 domain-containing protein n=1 Tax=Panagrellus redivivus TaxID=6233 RepID=A0A7E4VPM3_PANRE
MPSRKVDLDSWKSDLLGAGVNVESHEVSEKGRKLTVFLLFRLFHVCSSTAHFRETLLRFLGHDPKLMPPNVMPVDKLRKGTNKIVAFESSEIDLKRIGFVSECLNPPAMPRLLPNIDCFEPMPKISRASTEKGPPSPAELEKALRNVNQKLEYWQGKCRSAELKSVEFESLQKSNEELHLKLSHANSTIEKLKIQLAQLERDIEMHSKATVPSVQPDHKQFNLKNRKGYTAKALTLFGQLSIDFQVAEAKVGRVLETVANFFGITLDSLPSARTVGRAMYIISAIAAEQISEIVEQKGVEFTLMSDETTKKFNKLQAFVVTYLNEQTQQLERLYLDVEAVSNKSSPRQLEAFQTAFEDIAARAQKCKSTFFDKFIVKVKNFMGDHAATQVKFAQLCTEYREMIIRDVYPDFEHLSEEEQSLILTTNVIFCFLHLTSNTTPKVLQVLKDDEAKQTGKTGGKKSTVEAFLVEMGRYFGSRTAARYSSVGKWRFKSRFHMVFIIAVQVLYNRDHLIAFVTDHFDDGDIRDFLLTSLQNDLIISHLMVMAAIEINILGPLRRLAERSPNPVDSHLWINAILDFFDKIKANPMLLFTDTSRAPILDRAPDSGDVSTLEKVIIFHAMPYPWQANRLWYFDSLSCELFF